MKIFQKQLLRAILQEKLFLKFHNIYSKNFSLWPATLMKKRLCYRRLNFVKLLRTPFLKEHLRWLYLVLSFK